MDLASNSAVLASHGWASFHTTLHCKLQVLPADPGSGGDGGEGCVSSVFLGCPVGTNDITPRQREPEIKHTIIRRDSVKNMNDLNPENNYAC